MTPRATHIDVVEVLAPCAAGAGPAGHSRGGGVHACRSLTGLCRSMAGLPSELAGFCRPLVDLAGSRPSLIARPYHMWEPGLAGLFPRSSLLRQVHEERVVGLLYGQRALCVGAGNPLNYVATVLHSTGRRTPFRRLARTGVLLEAIIFGEWGVARAAVDEVNAVHKRVEGVLPVEAGRFAQGKPYSANDPELLLWTLAVLADSAIYFYELFVRSLDAQELDLLWIDYRRFGELFGLDRGSGPQTYASFQTWWHEALRRFELTPEAQKTGYAVAFEIPLPSYLAPVRRFHNAILKGSLPVSVRDGYGISYTSKDRARFERARRKIVNLRRGLPGLLTRGQNTYYFQYVARTERRRVASGRPTPELAVPHRDRHCGKA